MGTYYDVELAMIGARRHRVQTWDRRGGILGIRQSPTPRNGDN